MANSITLSTAGKLAFADFSDLSNDINITTSNCEFTSIITASGNYIKKTVGGLSCALTPSGQSYEYARGFGITYDASTPKKIFCQVKTYRPNTNSQIVAGKASTGSGNLMLWLMDYLNGLVTWDINHTQYNEYIAPRYCVNNGWSLLQNFSSHTEGSEQFIKDIASGKVTASTKSTYIPISDGFGHAAGYLWTIAGDNRSGGNIYLTAMLYAKDKRITITGLAAGMVVQLLNSDDNIIKTEFATNTSLTIDVFGIENPIVAKFKIIGTDGVTCYADTNTNNIFGGDSWAYSGETTGAAEVKKTGIKIDGGVIC